MRVVDRQIIGIAFQHAERFAGREIDYAANILRLGCEKDVGSAEKIHLHDIGRRTLPVIGQSRDVNDGLDRACGTADGSGVEDVEPVRDIEPTDLVTSDFEPTRDDRAKTTALTGKEDFHALRRLRTGC